MNWLRYVTVAALLVVATLTIFYTFFALLVGAISVAVLTGLVAVGCLAGSARMAHGATEVRR